MVSFQALIATVNTLTYTLSLAIGRKLLASDLIRSQMQKSKTTFSVPISSFDSLCISENSIFFTTMGVLFITNSELFRCAAEAGPLDIVKLRKKDKIFNISPHLPGNKADDPYVLQVFVNNYQSRYPLRLVVDCSIVVKVTALKERFGKNFLTYDTVQKIFGVSASIKGKINKVLSNKMYVMVCAVDLITKIGDLEVLVLIVSCICHDLDHPGYNNIYQINARTELALRYNDISPLENHHCSVAFHILEAPECNILASLQPETYRIVREGIIRCILATDMARHNEILAQFTDAVPDFDYSSKVHINLLSMVLIKVADISNEARPMDVAEPWLDSLLQEFFKQSDAEKLEGLPVTPFMDRDKVTKPSSQCSFIGLVLLPLFEILGELFPELQELIIEPVRYALDYYKRLNEAAKDERHQRKSMIDLDDRIPSDLNDPHNSGQHHLQQNLHQHQSNISFMSSSGIESEIGSIVKSVSSHSMRSKRSTTTLHSRSRSIEDDDAGAIDNTIFEQSADHESSDPETATEVEISEKTLKFKISTEENCSTSTPGRKSYPNSRKGSREKSSLEYYNHDFTKAMREHERERRRSRAENLCSDINSPISTRSNDVESRILEEFKRDDQHYVELVFTEDNRKMEGNGILVVDTAQHRRNNRISKRTASMDSNELMTKTCTPTEIVKDAVRCCCDDKFSPNNHKSFLSRLRNLTDRLSMSFDTKEPSIGKSEIYTTVKDLNKSITINNSSKCDKSLFSQPVRSTNIITTCKKCNLSKLHKKKELRESVGKVMVDHSSNNSDEARLMTLPKVKRSQDNKNKSWRTVFAKEKRPSMSLETLPAEDTILEIQPSSVRRHRRNLSNPEGKDYSSVSNNQSLQSKRDPTQNINFREIDIRPSMPEIFVDPINASCSSAIEDIDKVEIRRSSASMEDISKIIKQNEIGILDCSLVQQKSIECQQHTGSLDSMLNKDTTCKKEPVGFYASKFSQSQSKKTIPSFFSRLKSGINIDSPGNGNRSISKSGSIHEQQTGSWISSITSSFRPRRQGELLEQSQAQTRQQQQERQQPPVKSSSHEEIK
ncbi:uncharacterized protein LOC100116395 isoform X3 [Nasonia vitripennis]|uniref:Phosphodiesterase n=1 Tax=Nasonia vitripennis TaxID=7425 RepID=A0A7M7QMV4_NASVI|nr:uncharacterized protein LOC100116395 isoform X3 [Nasonia vitripennis]